ncbi:hypothetical protein ABO55_003501 [Salmonella enterica subsp. enterica]|nr:hypothetical protein [Salmonella enterica subsp. enterica serovar Abony]
MDEFWHFLNPNLMRSTHHLYKDNMINVIDKPITPLESIREYLRGDTYSRGGSLLIPTQEQIALWRKATGNEGGIAEYQQWILATCNHAKK